MSFIVDNWLFLMNGQLFIGGFLIVGVSDWQFTFIDDSCYLLVVVLVTLDINFEVVVYFWSWYLCVDLVWDVSIGMSVLSILIISSSWVVCVTLKVVLFFRIPCLGLFYNLIIYAWIIHYLSYMVGMRAWLGDHAIVRSSILTIWVPLRLIDVGYSLI